jgi:hypothetical protein
MPSMSVYHIVHPNTSDSRYKDLSQVRTGSAPEVMTILRNVVLGVLHANIAETIRQISWTQGRALSVLGLAPK